MRHFTSRSESHGWRGIPRRDKASCYQVGVEIFFRPPTKNFVEGYLITSRFVSPRNPTAGAGFRARRKMSHKCLTTSHAQKFFYHKRRTRSARCLTTSHNVSRRLTTSHDVSQRLTTSHNVSRRLTTSHNVSQRLTTSHNVSQRLTTSHNVSRRLTPQKIFITCVGRFPGARVQQDTVIHNA